MSATGRPTDRQSDQHADGSPDQPPVALPRQRAIERAADETAPSADQPTAASTSTLLVVGDDPTGSFGTPELLDTAGNRVRIRRARNLTEAERLLTDDVTCVLLDLHLPDPHLSDAGGESGMPARLPAAGLDALRELLRLAPTTAVLALADGEEAAELAAEAVRVGAQDYLFRDELDASLLNRAMRYAVERKRADIAQLQLTETHLLAQENARLERGLLPTPLLDGTNDLRFAARYRPGRSRALLGGDFYDIVRTPGRHRARHDRRRLRPRPRRSRARRRTAHRLARADLRRSQRRPAAADVAAGARVRAAGRRDLRHPVHRGHHARRPPRGPVPGRPPVTAAAPQRTYRRTAPVRTGRTGPRPAGRVPVGARSKSNWAHRASAGA